MQTTHNSVSMYGPALLPGQFHTADTAVNTTKIRQLISQLVFIAEIKQCNDLKLLSICLLVPQNDDL